MPVATVNSPTVSCDEALRIARLDAERVYRDLAPYRVIVKLQSDGWHIDFELDDDAIQGGGPHYVIDSSMAKIISKRYEQ